MPFRSLGGSRIIGSGVPQPTPIALDPAPFLGSLVYGQDGRVYASNGTAWVDIGSGAVGPQGTQGIQGVQGLQGDYGPGFTIIGSVANVDTGGDPQATLNAAFPTANIGEGVIDETDDELWIYVGSSVWVNIGSFRGVQGFTGIQGVQGNQGTIGEEGIQGSRGFRGNQGVQGIQGADGFQGTQGIQGNQGAQGTRGLQGVQGTLGIQGIQGPRGFQGIQGPRGFQGIQGDTGIQGIAGDFGGLSYDFTYDNVTTDSDPGTGNVRFSSTNLASPGLVMYIDDQDDGGVQVTDGIMTELAGVAGSVKGYMKIVNGANIYDQATFRIDSSVVDATGYWRVSVTLINGVTSFTNGTDFRISFVRNGEQGIQGDQGLQGIQGTRGIQGGTGIQGDQGLQGTTGVQGTTGIQGSRGIQGLLGDTGSQGTQGIQGPRGIQGAQGVAGSYGGAAFEYNYSPDITPTAPSSGVLKLNSSTVTSATVIRLSDTDAFGSNIETFLRTLDLSSSALKAYIKVTSIQNPQDFLLYSLDSLTEASTSFNFSVTYLSKSVDASAAYFTTNPDIVVSFTVTGDQGVQGFQGFQGATGIQGDLGIQGSTGAGTQGLQGIQGDLGFQGVQGFPGPIGPQGVQGNDGLQGTGGLQGATGGFGGITFDYTWSTNTVATDPGVGFIKANNAALPSATAILIDDRDDNFVDIQPFLRTIDDSTSPIKGHFKITSKTDPTHFVIYSINSLAENAGYFTISCAHVSGTEVASFPNNYDITITFARTGDVGPAGPQGTSGIQGNDGIQGANGEGIQGIQGPRGIQGNTGSQGTSGFVGGSGIQGFRGFQGFQGIQGLAGNDGQEGSQGAQGLQGSRGFQGENGSQGVQGERGLDGTGATGIQGFRGFQGTQGSQSVQGIQGAEGFQGTQGPFGGGGSQGTRGFQGFQGMQGIQGLDGDGNQGTQGFQGPAGIGDEGLQGPGGFQGLQGFRGFSGDGGVQGAEGLQGFQGLQGGVGPGGVGSQGVQGIQGDFGIQGPVGAGAQGAQGFQGIQGDLGIQGFPGSGAQGIQGIQGTEGLQGFRGFQGTQGLQGFGNEGSVKNLQNIHTSNLQSTAMFITFVEGGATERPLLATLGPNPGGESNFFYTGDADELSVENINVGGNITVAGTVSATGISGVTSDLVLPADVAVAFDNSEHVRMFYEGSTTRFTIDTDISVVNSIRIDNKSTGAAIFTFNVATGEFIASGDVTTNSDARLKENVVNINNALDKVMNMRGVYFNKIDNPDVRKIGLIAQEVESVIPEAVSTDNEGDKIKSVAYGSLIGLLIEAIKDLNEKVDHIKVQ